MSEEVPGPEEVLLTSSDGGGGGKGLLALGLLGGGVALVALGMKGKKDKKDKKEGSEESGTVEVKSAADEVAFGKDLGTHQIGATWRENVLGPYLEDAAEERTLATRSWGAGDGGLGGGVVTPGNVNLYMDHTRNLVLAAFHKTHTVKTPSGEKVINDLATTPSVSQFKSTVEEWTKQFQETF